MIYGYLRKISKSQYKTGYSRFFLLHRPPWMDLNNLYFFDANKIGEDKKPSKHLVLSDVNEVKCFDSASA